MVDCAGCLNYPCYRGEKCARGQELNAYGELSKMVYEKAEERKIMEVAARIEGEHYMEWTRLEEIMQFCREMGYRRIGLAHCVGLTGEALLVKKILEREFSVAAICCKFSGINKKNYGLAQVNCSVYEAICNPVGQAMVLNDEKTDLNLIIGLCVGHDLLFTRYSEAPVTTLIVKDRVTGHNPAVVLYSNYYKKKLLR